MKKIFIIIFIACFTSPVLAQPNIQDATSEVDRPYEQEAEDALYTEPGTPVIESEKTAEEEKGGSTVVLTDFGNRKINVIKAVRKIKDCGLKEAKDIVGSVPSIVVENVTLEEAQEVKAELEKAGGYAEIE